MAISECNSPLQTMTTTTTVVGTVLKNFVDGGGISEVVLIQISTHIMMDISFSIEMLELFVILLID